MKKLFVIVALVVSSFAIAGPAQEAPEDCDGLIVATGPTGKAYHDKFLNIAKVCGSKVQMCENQTSGGLENLTALSLNKADIGLTTVDAIATMRTGDQNIADLQQVVSLDMNYLHVFVASSGFTVDAGRKWYGSKDTKFVSIKKFSELKGQNVAATGSTILLGRKINALLGLNINFIDVKSDDEAFKKVKSGEAAAALAVSGWPMPAATSMSQDFGLTLIPFDVTISAPYVVKPITYSNLAVYNNNSLAVPNVLVTRPFEGDRSKEVAKLKACITENLSNFKEGRFSPGWKEVKNLNESYDIPKFNGGGAVSASVVSTKRK